MELPTLQVSWFSRMPTRLPLAPAVAVNATRWNGTALIPSNVPFV